MGDRFNICLDFEMSFLRNERKLNEVQALKEKCRSKTV